MIFIVVSAVLLFDQLTKFIVSRELILGQSLPVIEGVLHFTLIYNRGAAFGILKNQLSFFILTSAIAVVLIVISLNKNKRFVYNFSLALMLSGALGNLTDRLFLGHVVDFIDFRIWPVFNVADSAITIGAVLLGVAILKDKN
jgi:signal peptidase II